MKTYTVRAERWKTWWGLQCVEHPNIFSQSHDLAGCVVIKEAISWLLDEPEDSFDIKLEVVMNTELAEALAQYREALDEEARVVDTRRRLQVRLVKRLTKNTKLSYRDAAELLGISHQRVGQILAAESKQKTHKNAGPKVTSMPKLTVVS